jgi:RHS repeat-associated protein
LIQEYQAGGPIVASYLHGATGPVKNLSNNRYYYQDGSGSTSHLASSTGQLLWWFRYDLDGTPIVYNSLDNQISGAGFDLHLFTGQQWYSELGLYDLRNRFYSPDIGRFLQPDPIGFAGDASNLYRYCRNNPLKWSDPSGLAGGGNPGEELLTEDKNSATAPGVTVTGTVNDPGQGWRGLLPGESLSGPGGINSGPSGYPSGGGNFRLPRVPAIADAEGVVVTGDPVEPPPQNPPPNPFNVQLLNQLLFHLWMGPFHPQTAIYRGMLLTLRPIRQNKSSPFASHYGPGDEIGGWDPNNDRYTNAGLNAWGGNLDQNTVAMDPRYAAQQGIWHYGPVYIGPQYIGIWADKGPPFGRVDIYDPYNYGGTNWGGYIWDAEVSSHP